MADRLQHITSTRQDPEDCEACAEDEPCDHHWLVDELHRIRGAIEDHRKRVEFHREAARERHADLGAREDDLHGIHQDLWAAMEGRDSPV